MDNVSKETVNENRDGAKAKKKTAKKSGGAGFCVYLGPSIRGVIQTGTVYRGDKPEVLDLLAPAIEKYPLIASLVVGGNTTSRRPYQSKDSREPAECELQEVGLRQDRVRRKLNYG